MMAVEGTSQTERVVLTLRQMLLRGEFRPGERLAELSLVPMLNASRTPVRLALERLAHQGLLDALPSGGFRVRSFTVQDIRDAIQIRGVLEGTAARLAAERLADPNELEGLRKALRDMEGIFPEDLDRFVRYLEVNGIFHRELWRLAKSPMLLRALESVCSLPFAEPGALVFGRDGGPPPGEPQRGVIALEHHRAIAEAVANREGARAESLAREHSIMAWRNLEWALGEKDRLRHMPGASLLKMAD